jgi:phospholipid/cholesterol/gamma-HCH transport system ATP-binding protein
MAEKKTTASKTRKSGSRTTGTAKRTAKSTKSRASSASSTTRRASAKPKSAAGTKTRTRSATKTSATPKRKTDPLAAQGWSEEDFANRDYVIPGVEADDPNPYKWHTGKKRDHGGTDAIEVIDLVKQFGRTRILNGCNLGLPDDMISMVLGPSGTGKSVLIKHIVGLLYPDSGDVLVHGESIPNMSDDELFETRKKFGLLFQDGALFGSMNVYDNVCFPLRQHTDKSEDEIDEIVTRRLGEVGLAEAHYKMPNELSGGMRKRAGFGSGPGQDGAPLRVDP